MAKPARRGQLEAHRGGSALGPPPNVTDGSARSVTDYVFVLLGPGSWNILATAASRSQSADTRASRQPTAPWRDHLEP
eukprot:scaffold4781_cov105-Pinguiococcus_pyrenoidosus.AAC.1